MTADDAAQCRRAFAQGWHDAARGRRPRPEMFKVAHREAYRRGHALGTMDLERTWQFAAELYPDHSE